MNAYTVPSDIHYETTGADGAPVEVIFAKGDVTPADEREAALLSTYVALGLVSVKSPKSKSTTSADADSKE